MKNFKRILSIILCLTVLAAFAPMVCAGDKIAITKLSADFAIPAAGEKMDLTKISVPEGSHYTANIATVYHWVNSEVVYVNSEDVIEEGVRYFVRIQFNADEGYKIDKASNIEVVINGKVEKSWVGTNMVETVFTGQVKGPEVEPKPEKLSFMDYVKKVLSIIFFPITFIVRVIRNLLKK